MHPFALGLDTSSPPTDLSRGAFVHPFGSLLASFANAKEQQLILMASAYGRHGGIATGDEVTGLMRGYVDQPLSVLARAIVTRSLVSFVWRSEIWIPLFQFDQSKISLRLDVQQVVHELAYAFDDWELALWFARPNIWLQQVAPLAAIDKDLSAALQAARADRFVAIG
jgi:hypothetical protein